MKSIQYIDRASSELKTEIVAGWGALKWLHQGVLGKFFLEYAVKHRFLSWLYGLWMSSFLSRWQISGFVESLSIDMDEAVIPVDGFSSFNDFFARRLKPEARPVVVGEEVCCVPADGRVLVIQKLDQDQVFLVKGVQFNLGDFLQDEEMTKRYLGGSMVIVRLCPSDYHRFHFPLDGVPGSAKRIGGYFYSVNPLAIQYKPDLFVKNERQVCEMKTAYGKVCLIEVGATMVGKVVQTYTPKVFVNKGDEKGYFEFGASTVVLLFEPDRIDLDEDLVANTYKGYETLCKMGGSLGKLRA